MCSQRFLTALSHRLPLPLADARHAAVDIRRVEVHPLHAHDRTMQHAVAELHRPRLLIIPPFGGFLMQALALYDGVIIVGILAILAIVAASQREPVTDRV